MSRKAKVEASEMEALNVDLPADMIALVKLAKALTKQPIRLIVREAIEDWLNNRGLTADKLPKMREPKR
jgi:hypothetical protein